MSIAIFHPHPAQTPIISSHCRLRGFGGVYVECSLSWAFVGGRCFWEATHLDMVFVLIGCFGGGLWSCCVCCVCVCVCVVYVCAVLQYHVEFGKTNPDKDLLDKQGVVFS